MDFNPAEIGISKVCVSLRMIQKHYPEHFTQICSDVEKAINLKIIGGLMQFLLDLRTEIHCYGSLEVTSTGDKELHVIMETVKAVTEAAMDSASADMVFLARQAEEGLRLIEEVTHIVKNRKPPVLKLVC